jgi:thioredoxin 1
MMNIDKGISLVKFGASWCAPCKVVETTINKVKSEFQSINFVSIDVDDNPELAKEYKIRRVPTVICFRDGEEINRTDGIFQVQALRSLLTELTKENAA